jgi:hypothetical protein
MIFNEIRSDAIGSKVIANIVTVVGVVYNSISL